MSITRDYIQDFKERENILSTGGISGILLGGFIGLIIGTYTAAKYNTMASLDLGIIISIVLSTIWIFIVTVWTRNIDNIGVRIRFTAINALFFVATTYIGYFFGAVIGVIGTAILSRTL